MVYRKRWYRHRVIPYAAGAALAAAKTGYGLAKSAISRWRKKLSGRRKSIKSAGRVSRRRFRRNGGKFLKSIGLTNHKVVTLVYRGEKYFDLPGTANFNDLVKFAMNDPRNPGVSEANISALWSKTATGFTHMAAMYDHWIVLGSIAYINIRPARIFNSQYTTSGSSSYTSIMCVPMKCGVVMTDTAIGNEGITGGDSFYGWDAAKLKHTVKTLRYNVQTEPLGHVTLVAKYSHRKFEGDKSTSIDNWGHGPTDSPGNVKYACVWMQSADKISVPSQTRWDVSWTIKYITKFTEFKGPESDMVQTVIPS